MAHEVKYWLGLAERTNLPMTGTLADPKIMDWSSGEVNQGIWRQNQKLLSADLSAEELKAGQFPLVDLLFTYWALRLREYADLFVKTGAEIPGVKVRAQHNPIYHTETSMWNVRRHPRNWLLITRENEYERDRLEVDNPDLENQDNYSLILRTRTAFSEQADTTTNWDVAVNFHYQGQRAIFDKLAIDKS